MDAQETPRQTNPKPNMAYPQAPPSLAPRYPSIHNGSSNAPRLPLPQQQPDGPLTPPGAQPRAAVPFNPARGPILQRQSFPPRPPGPRPGIQFPSPGGPRFPPPGSGPRDPNQFPGPPPGSGPRDPNQFPGPPPGSGPRDPNQFPGPPRPLYPGPRPFGPDPSLIRQPSLSQEGPKDLSAPGGQEAPKFAVSVRGPNFGSWDSKNLQRNDSTSSIGSIQERTQRVLPGNTMADVVGERRQSVVNAEEKKVKLPEAEPSPAIKNDEPETVLKKEVKKPSDSVKSIEEPENRENIPVPAIPDSQTKNTLEIEGRKENLTSGSQDGVQGFDNGRRRSLSSRSASKEEIPKIETVRTPDRGKKKTHFAEDEAVKEKQEEKPGSGQGSKQARENLAKLPLSAKSAKKSDAENDSGVDESTQRREAPTTNGLTISPTKKFNPKSREDEKRSTAASPVKSPSKSSKSLPRTPDSTSSNSLAEKKKLPMNKIQVGAAPSPNLKTVTSKIGSLANTTYKPGGGKVKIENRKLDFSKAQPKITAKNDKYTPSGGDKKITQVKLQWNAKPKVGSLGNTTYKPGGGDKKIESVKLDFKDKAKSKVGSKDNAGYTPGGGNVKSPATPPKTPQDSTNGIETQKVDIKAESKIGSLNNVKHKPGGGDKKIFDDKDYLKQTGSNVESVSGSGSQSPIPSGTFNSKNGLPTSDENLNQAC